MRELILKYLESGLSRRGFVRSMAAMGFTAAAAEALLEPLEASEAAASRADTPGTVMLEGTGGELCVAQAKAAGVEYLFTNPGSYEVGFFDAFTDTPGIQLIMGLHEGVVISMADGYHRVSRKPAFVNVHAVAGTAQMGGQLYNASRDGSALVITAGLNDNELFSDDSTLAPRPGFDQKEIPRQFTKICWESRRAETIPLMLRRAFKTAATEPGGPVYIALAGYALEARHVKAQILPAERFLLRARVRPAAAQVEQAVKLLADSKRPVIVAGDEVWKSGAVGDLVAFSESLGIPVATGSQGFMNFPSRHPHALGAFSMGSEFIGRGVDTVIFLGARDFGDRTIPAVPLLPQGAKIARIGIDTAAMGRNYPTDLALVGDVKEALADLSAAVHSGIPEAKRNALAASRSQEIRAFSSAQHARMDAGVRASFGKTPIHPDELGHAISKTIEPNSILVSENLTGRYQMFDFGYRDNELMWLYNTGFSLGWGIGASIGAALAAPHRPVVCCIGDGSVMYSASGFWTQARYSIPVLTIVYNNHDYQTVRHAYYNYRGRMASSGHYAGMYLGNPDIDFVKLAESQGVAGERVTKGSELEGALRRGVKTTRDGKPYLLEVDVARYGGGAESTWYEKFSLAEKRKA